MICISSTATFHNCYFTAADGGAGGQAGDGGTAIPGGLGSPGGTACPGEVGAGGDGGDGGSGGFGGGGGGGNGGSSIAVYLLGNAAPVLDQDCTFQTGSLGTEGQGGLAGDGLTQASAGFPGTVTDVLNQVSIKKK